MQGRPPTVQGRGLAAAQLVGLPQRGDLPAAGREQYKQYKRRAVQGEGARAMAGAVLDSSSRCTCAATKSSQP